MIKRRNKEVEQIIESDSEDKNSESLFNIQRKTYEEQVVKVLDILEKKGINIYDTNRHGGMYLKNPKKQGELNKLFQQNKPVINNNDDNPKDLKNLFEFFNKKKNNE